MKTFAQIVDGLILVFMAAWILIGVYNEWLESQMKIIKLAQHRIVMDTNSWFVVLIITVIAISFGFTAAQLIWQRVRENYDGEYEQQNQH